MNFPKTISFTLTNACNLRCKMCGQWSEEGYMHKNNLVAQHSLSLEDWKRLVDEIAAHNITSVIIRGGEPFLFPGIIELLEYINNKGIFASIDTNGTLVKKYAADIIRIGKIHLTFSVDGPEEIHDEVRGLKGCFKKIKESIDSLNELEKNSKNKISRGICFTISPFSIKGLGKMPDVARSLSINTLVIVPYYYVPNEVGRNYGSVLKTHFNCAAFSWQGFHHEESHINFNEFQKEYNEYLDGLNGIYNYPYMKISEEDYQKWFSNPFTLIGSSRCSNIEKLIDIQPDGNANFCVDFPDYNFGNVMEATIEELWNNKRAEKFREYRRDKLLPVCYRCGAKYMSEIVS
jgi:radical SAM protein with 4Fe4S-binding SPASM domain